MTELPFTHIIPGMASSELVLVEGGTFMMGSDEYDSEKPVHEVTVLTFAIGKYPVTQELWMAVMGDNPSFFVGAQRPVDGVSWENAQIFFQKIKQEITSLYGLELRLPSEAEWEYAARGGNKSGGFIYAGSNKLNEIGWYNANSHGETKPVGLKLPNELGIHDLSGNVWEWCADQWHNNYKGALKNGSAWIDQEEWGNRVQRGGSWHDNPSYGHTTYRTSARIIYRPYDVGFRIVLGSPPDS